MNKKKMTTGLVALGLVGVVGIGGSLAWFTDLEQKTNTLTLNHVNITLEEPGYTDNQTLLPGDTITKDPTVTVEKDSSAAWIRIQPLVVNVDFANDGKVDDEIAINSKDALNTFGIQLGTGWTLDENTGYFYYESSLAAEGKTTPLFSSITIPHDWGNKYAEAKVTLDIQAEAVQYANTGATAKEAFENVGAVDDYDRVSTTITE